VRSGVVVAVCIGAALGGTAGAAPRASLRVVERAPLVLRGTGFKPRETVRVRLMAPAALRVVRASRAGGFVVRFRGVDRCGGILVVRAAGAQGDHVLLRLPRPQCPPP
jgi:hypothetical protein